MSALTRELKIACEQEGVSFQQFIQKLRGEKGPQEWAEQGNQNGESEP